MIRVCLLGLVLAVGTACQVPRATASGSDTIQVDRAVSATGALPAQLMPPFRLGADFPTGVVMDSQPTRRLYEGEAVPDFQIVFPDGETTTLSALSDRAVLLNFWATWCGPCRHEIPLLLDQQAVREDDWLVLAINVKETQSKVEAFAETFNMKMPIILDPQGEVVDLFRVRGFPTSIFLDREGQLVATWTGVLDEAKLVQLVEASLP